MCAACECAESGVGQGLEKSSLRGSGAGEGSGEAHAEAQWDTATGAHRGWKGGSDPRGCAEAEAAVGSADAENECTMGPGLRAPPADGSLADWAVAGRAGDECWNRQICTAELPVHMPRG